MKKPAIQIKDLCKSYGDKEILTNFSLTVNEGEIMSIFGPNGSGKSTLLNIISGVSQKDGGEILLSNKNIGYIFQNYRSSLLPWRTNYKNLAFPLEVGGLKPKEIKERIEKIQKLFNVQIDWDSYPYNLSGGQQQLLSFMRAVLTKPKILLIDEAFSALDFENNLFLRDKLQKYYMEEGPAILMVTHNIEEAVHLSGKIVVLPRPPIKNQVAIDNPSKYPRSTDFLITDTFHKTKDSVLCSFREKLNI